MVLITGVKLLKTLTRLCRIYSCKALIMVKGMVKQEKECRVERIKLPRISLVFG